MGHLIDEGRLFPGEVDGRAQAFQTAAFLLPDPQFDHLTVDQHALLSEMIEHFYAFLLIIHMKVYISLSYSFSYAKSSN